VYSSDLLKSLAQEEIDLGKKDKDTKRSPKQTTLSRAGQRMMEKKEEKRRRDAEMDLEIKKRSQRKVQAGKDKEEREFQKTMKSIDGTFNFIEREVSPMLDATELTRRRKKRELYEQWIHEVYEPIYSQIDKNLGKLDSAEISRRKRDMFEEFIKTSNNKLLFRDIVLEDEYDPMKAHTHNLKYYTKKLKDPLKQYERNRAEEDMIAKKAPVKDKTKGLVDVTQWNKFEDTTVGRLEKLKNLPIDKNYKPGTVQEHYKVSKSQDLVNQEFFRGGKKSYGEMQKSNIPGLSSDWAS